MQCDIFCNWPLAAVLQNNEIIKQTHLECFTFYSLNVKWMWATPSQGWYTRQQSILHQFCKTAKLKSHEANNLRFLKLKCHLLGEMGFGVEFSQVADLISFSTWSDILMLQSASDPTSNKSRKCCSSSQIFTLSGKILAQMQRKSALRRKKNLLQCFFHYNQEHTYDLTQRIGLKEQHLLNANFGENFLSK